MFALDWDRDDVEQCLLDLEPRDFDRSQRSFVPGHEGKWQDYYRLAWGGKRLFIKIQLDANRPVVISFKEDDQPWTRTRR